MVIGWPGILINHVKVPTGHPLFGMGKVRSLLLLGIREPSEPSLVFLFCATSSGFDSLTNPIPQSADLPAGRPLDGSPHDTWRPRRWRRRGR